LTAGFVIPAFVSQNYGAGKTKRVLRWVDITQPAIRLSKCCTGNGTPVHPHVVWNR
jgi:hypothetical protein